MAASSNHAIVYGASGIIGWAIVDQLLRAYPDAGSFKKVTAVTNRPLELSETYWPESDSQGPELQLVSGIDLRSGDGATLAGSLTRTVNEIETVTHIFYLVFNAIDDDIEEVKTNLHMLQNVVDAHSLTSPDLKFVAFPGGTRGYGIYAPGGTFSPPLTEDMVNNLPSDYAKTVVYPAYRELLNKASQGKKWTWCEVCPDAIIGFTPNGSQFSLALHWAQWLSLYAYNYGVGPGAANDEDQLVEVQFPGNGVALNALFSPVSSKTIARFMIYASLHPNICGGGKLFNIADSETPSTFRELWPKLAAWFGLEGVDHNATCDDDGYTLRSRVGDHFKTTSILTPGRYVLEHGDVFRQLRRDKALSGGVGAGNLQLDSVGFWLTFDRQLSLERLRSTGFEGERDPVEGWLESFQMFRKAGLII